MPMEPMPGEMPCPAAEAAAPVDLAHLARYTLGDRNLERELLYLFRDQARVQARCLATARDQTGWRSAAHLLKGSSRSIGAWRIAAAAEAAEAVVFAALAARERALAELDRAIAEAEAEIERICAGR
jgi:HPt (histidine-containing phosphotransfer) domain-containing protein